MSLLITNSNGETFEYNGQELKHYGVKGQKWAVRRYQNPDGSLTAEGKRRYGSVENYNIARAKSSSRNKKIAAGVGTGALVLGAGALALRSNAGRKALKRAMSSVKKIGSNKESVKLNRITNLLNNKKTRVSTSDLKTQRKE